MVSVFFWILCHVRISFAVFDFLRRKVSETRHELRCLYFLSKAILKLSQSVKGHFVTLIDDGMHFGSYLGIETNHRTQLYFKTNRLKIENEFSKRRLVGKSYCFSYHTY